MKHLLFLIVLIFTLPATLYAQSPEFKVTSFTHEANSMLARLNHNVRQDDNDEACALVLVRTAETGLGFTANTVKVGDADWKNGEYWLYVSQNTRSIKVFKQGIETLEYTLEIIPKSRETYLLKLQVIRPELKVAILPVTIITTPENANLSIDGKKVSSQTKTHQLTKGTHNIVLQIPGYERLERSIDINKNNVYFDLILNEVSNAGLMIESEPAGAEVYLDGVKLGQTPISAFYPPGTYPVKLIKDGYVTIENETLIVTTPQTRKKYILEENIGHITINTFETAKVYINGIEYANTKNIKLSPQLLNIRVTMPKADDVEKQLVLKRNDNLNIDLYPDATTASIQVAATPFDAEIEITGDAGEHYTATGMHIFRDIPIGQYTIKVKADAYSTVTKTLTLTANQVLNQNIKLEKIASGNNEVVSVEGGSFTDTRDGQTYKTVKIGNQKWMAENLNYKTNDSWCYNDNKSNCDKYGRLYTWESAINACPTGWHLPSDNEWKQLEIALGMSKSEADITSKFRGIDEGKKMKSLTGWHDNGTNSSGFCALGGDMRHSAGWPNGNSISPGGVAFWWSSSEYSDASAFYRRVSSSSDQVYRTAYHKTFGFSVRCLKNPTLKANKVLNQNIKPNEVTTSDIELVLVKGGTFSMGSNDGDDDEKSIHEVSLNDFYIGKYEVTQKQWREIMGNNPSSFAGCDNCPVEQVSWNDIQEFIKKLNQQTGKKYRLPTEAEWEYAARGGVKSVHTSALYAGSNNIDNVAWYKSNSGSKSHPVGTKSANELGIYDMTGNVWEWCSDRYAQEYYKRSPKNNPQGSSLGSDRVGRGGGWYSLAASCRVGNRYSWNIDDSSNKIGFRLALSSPTTSQILNQNIKPKEVVSINIELVFVKGSTFSMGSNEYDYDEKPIHQVTLNDFYIGKYEVTQKQWRDIMGNNPSNFAGCDNCPVEKVSWNEVQIFIKKLNQKTGKNYRLPTEAEWEYAARGGNKSNNFKYSGSNNYDKVSWYDKSSSDKGEKPSGYGTKPIGTKDSNELGIYDMSGNVWEWCSDMYSKKYYRKSPQNNPQGSLSSPNRVSRGGSWSNDPLLCRVANRLNGFPDGSYYNLGFRLVLSIP